MQRRTRGFEAGQRELPAFKNHPTDAEGRFELSVAPDFVGSVHASHPDNSMVQAKVDGIVGGTRDLVLQLPFQR